MLSLAPADAQEAMDRCWEANTRAAQALQGAGLLGSLLGGGVEIEDAARIEHTLVSADAHMMGAMMQLILGNYVKGAWNISAAWRLYSGVFQEREESPDKVPPVLHCIADFGVGMFNLVVSLLPPTYLTIAQMAGFSGDRAQAIKLLNRSTNSGQYWSPVSCLLLLYFYTQLCPNLGMSQASHATEVDSLLASSAATAYPSASLFLWMQGGSKRLHGRLPEAKDLLMRAEEGSRGMPAMQAIILNDVVWVTIPSLDFGAAAAALALLLSSPNQTPYHGVYAYEAGLCLLVIMSRPPLLLACSLWLAGPMLRWWHSVSHVSTFHQCRGDADGAADLFATVADLAGAPGENEVGAERYAVHMARYLTGAGSKKPTKGEGVAALLELMILWDAHRMMGKEQAQAAFALLADADMSQRYAQSHIPSQFPGIRG